MAIDAKSKLKCSLKTIKFHFVFSSAVLTVWLTGCKLESSLTSESMCYCVHCDVQFYIHSGWFTSVFFICKARKRDLVRILQKIENYLQRNYINEFKKPVCSRIYSKEIYCSCSHNVLSTKNQKLVLKFKLFFVTQLSYFLVQVIIWEILWTIRILLTPSRNFFLISCEFSFLFLSFWAENYS